MRKLFATLFFLIGCAFTSMAQSYQITSANYDDSCLRLNLSITTNFLNSNYMSSKIETSYGDGIIDTAAILYQWFPYQYGPMATTRYGVKIVHNYTSTGTYTIKHVIIKGNLRYDSLIHTVNLNCKTVGGRFYEDLNNNCLIDTTDNNHFGTTLIGVDSAGIRVDTVELYNSLNWYYDIKALSNVTYVFTPLNITIPGYILTCPNNGAISYNYVPANPNDTSLNFGYTCNNCLGHITNRTDFDTCARSVVYIYSNVPQLDAHKYRFEYNWGDGTNTYGQLNGNQYNSYSNGYRYYGSPGTYTQKQVLLKGETRVDSNTSIHTISCNDVHGTMFEDANNNCTFDFYEYNLRYAANIRVDSAGIAVDTVSALGQWTYKILATSATTYTFTVLGNPLTYVSSCPSSSVVTYNFTPTNAPAIYLDFGFACSPNPGFDLSLTCTKVLRASTSAGRSFIFLAAENNSCDTQNAVVTLQVSPKYSINVSRVWPTPASITGNTIVWNLPNLRNSYNGFGLYAPLLPLSTTQIGDTACNYAIISPTVGDVNPANNVISICDSVRNSWDPNDKEVTPKGDITPGTLLTYTIQFENLGNDTAFNVHVQDTLSSMLDANSFQLLNASHPVETIHYIQGGQNIVKFDFPGIHLPDISHPEANKGFITYSIRSKASLAPDMFINNTAGIFFDGNAPVITNTVSSRISGPNSIKKLNAIGKASIFPNPANGSFTIVQQGNAFNKAKLLNLMGQLVAVQTLHSGNNFFDIAHLPAGIYMLQLTGEAGVETQKLEVK